MAVNPDFRDLFAELSALDLLINKRSVARGQDLLDVERLEQSREND